MAASLIGSSVISNRSPVASPRRLVVANASKAVEGDKTRISYENVKEGNNGRRDMMFAAAAAAVCSVAGMAMADEPKRGTAEAKKTYAPICVTMPTARICHKWGP